MNARLDDQFEDASILNLWMAKLSATVLKPANLVWSVSGVLAVGFVFSNALFFQNGKHPAAMFETRTTSSQHQLRADELGMSPQIETGRQAQPVTRIVLDSNSNRQAQNPLPPKIVTRPESAQVAQIEASEDTSSPVADLKELQQLLAELGFYDGKIDGLTGPKTRGAIEAYKANVGLRGIELTSSELATSARNNLIVTAAIPTTRPAAPQAIPSRKVETVRYTPPTSTRPAARDLTELNNQIAKVQAGLRAFGNESVGVDGKLGPQTVRAITEFQNLFKLPATGQIDQALISKMTDVGLIN